MIELLPSMYNERSAKAKVLKYLAEKGPSNPYTIWIDEKNRGEDDRIRRYATINEVVRELEKRGYLKLIRKERSTRGGEKLIYGLNGSDGLFAAIAYCGTGLDIRRTVDNCSLEAEPKMQDLAIPLVAAWTEVQGFSSQLVTLMRYACLQPASKLPDTIARALGFGAVNFPKDPKLLRIFRGSKVIKGEMLKSVESGRKLLDKIERDFGEDT